MEDSLKQWFVELRERLESAYLVSDEPWKQSGFSGPEERWEACRKPIADCMERSGTFLDIGCANGYLLECIMRWAGERGFSIIPYGIDLSTKLVALARKRLPGFENNLVVGNGLTWEPPRRFDYVRTELCYVPKELQEHYITRLIEVFLSEKGKLLVAEYRSRKDDQEREWQEGFLESLAVTIGEIRSGTWEGRELTRIVSVRGGSLHRDAC